LSSVSRLHKAAEPEGARGSEMITAGVPLAKLIKRKVAETPELVMLSRVRSMAAEKFRRLKTVLYNDPKGPQVLVVTSAGPGEGKSLVAANLALAFAADMSGEVLLIDADLRRPTVDTWLNPAPKLGLADLLRGTTELDHAILYLENSPLRVLPAGDPPPDPTELLSGSRAKALIAGLRQRFHRLIIDTPPIVPFTDADVIGAQADGMLLVARSGVTRRASYLQAVSAVTSTRLVGTVLNDLTFKLADRESHHHYQKGYHQYYSKERKR
jgi:capsular exopolysaccharide synthesis family protein